MKILIIVFVLLGSVGVKAITGNVCYGDLGCFSTTGSFAPSIQRPMSVVPQSPGEIKARFVLFTRESIDEPQYLDATDGSDVPNVFTNFVNRPTKIIIHGFLDNFEIDLWMRELAKELLNHDDYNVIVVDWSGGNRPPYYQATANTRLVGAQIAALIKSLIAAEVIIIEDIHIIGHSLGAHTAGYVGKIIPGIGRISGLDPAGPNFRDLDKHVRLDADDALFVDVIHTDASLLGFGTTTLSGHVDFFPNGGHGQPGCQKGLFSLIEQILQSGSVVKGIVPHLINADAFLNSSFMGTRSWFYKKRISATGQSMSRDFSSSTTGIIAAASCSHVRAIQFFKESIRSTCPFLAYPCPSEKDSQNKQCETCGGVGCSRMGFHADKYKPAGKTATYYLRTGDKEPFCSYHYTITVKLSAGVGSNESGIASISITGDKATSPLRSLIGFNDTTLNPGQTYTFYVDLPQDVGKVSSVSFWWEKTFSIFSIGQVSSLYIDGINVYAQEADATYKICNNGQRVDSGLQIDLSEPC